MLDATIVMATYGERLESSENMLPEILESIKALGEKNFRMVVINNTIDPEYRKRVEKKIDAAIAPFNKHFKVSQFSCEDLQKLHRYFLSHGYEDFIETMQFGNYSNFRNMGLMVANIIDSSIVVFIDDDELIEDKLFLKKARQFIGKTYKGKFLGGIAGYYINRDGSYLLPKNSIRQWWNVFWRKNRHMNKAFKIIGNKKRLNETSFAFGGNLVLHKKMFRRVPFDPYILRGEDIDLLISAKAYGFAFLLDNQLGIKHFPPKRTHGEWSTDMRRDAYRFIYERKKIGELVKEKKLQPKIIEALDPYPGRFLRKTIYLKLIATSFLLAVDAIIKFELRWAVEHFRNIKIALVDAEKYAVENSRKYLDFQKRWVTLMQEIAGDKQTVKYFKDKFE